MPFPALPKAYLNDWALPDLAGVGFGMREAAIINKNSPKKYIGTYAVNQCIAVYIHNPKDGIAAGTHLDPEYFDLPNWQVGLQNLLDMTRKDPATPLTVTLIGGTDGISEAMAATLCDFLGQSPNINLHADLGGKKARQAALCVDDGTITTNVARDNLQAWDDGETLYYKPFSMLPDGLDLIYLQDTFHRNPPIHLCENAHKASQFNAGALANLLRR